MLQIHGDSHVDHLTPPMIMFIVDKFKNYNTAFIESFEIPDTCKDLECGLYGPVMGDAPIKENEVFYAIRPGRKFNSRLTKLPKRPTRICTVIAGPHDGLPCVLYTAFGGPLSPKESGELLDGPLAEFEDSVNFWKDHALSQ